MVTANMLTLRVLWLTVLALLAFAGNSLLNRAAFSHTSIDATSFTLVRIISAALLLYLLLRVRRPLRQPAGSWLGAGYLFAYAAFFSFAYVQLDTATGALLLFGAVQLTMLALGVKQLTQVSGWQWAGAGLALAGIGWLLLPGASAPEPLSAFFMLCAGAAWGLYSLLGQRAGDAAANTAGNFLRASPLALGLCVIFWPNLQWDPYGVLLALISGAITSGLGYYIWYRVLPALSALQAASVQLAVPVLAAILGIVLLNEPLTLRLVIAAAVVLCGLGLVLLSNNRV
ncbi:DMT family transporter [Alishewanella sp. HL-SH05]|uniref:DMT family transporter n=1 Tax=Alishewanella sp. HL-SH05 TaxID=3461145 RepID=UPI0040417397